MKVWGIRCPRCAAEVWSRHRHDYRHCPCGYCAVDGGRAYTSVSWGVPYPHEGTQAEKDHAVAETARIGAPETVELEVPDDAPRPEPRWPY